MPSKLKKIQHLVHYFQRRNGTVSRNDQTMEPRVKANQTMLRKGNTMCLKNITDWEQSSLGTSNQRVEGSRSEATAPPMPWLQASTDFAKHVPGFREGTLFFLCTSGPRGKGTKAPIPGYYWRMFLPYIKATGKPSTDQSSFQEVWLLSPQGFPVWMAIRYDGSNTTRSKKGRCHMTRDRCQSVGE